jgi:hypothetical protein
MLFRDRLLVNPFTGQWQSEIPSLNNATVKFTFKQDGTFECEFPTGPDTTMTAVGGYLGKGNTQVTFMSYDGGVGAIPLRLGCGQRHYQHNRN